MKILLYHPWIYTKGGAERLILELAKNSRHDVHFITHFYDKHNTFPEFEKQNIKQLGKRKKLGGFLERGLFYGLKCRNTKLPLDDYDFFLISSSGIAEFLALKNHSIPVATYCHTILRVAHEFEGYYLQKQNFIKRLLYKLAIPVYRKLERKSWKYFSIIFANSKNTKSRIEKAELTEHPIKVLNPGVDISKFKPNFKHKNYFYASGRFREYKRFELAIEAFRLFKQKNKDFKLIIAGAAEKHDPYFKKIKALADKTERVELKTSVSDKEMIELYQNCFAYLFTAKNEDFGIVPIEAMACGKPVISVNEGGPKETILNNTTGFLVPATSDSFADKMLKLTKDTKLYSKLSKQAAEHAKSFSWKNFGKDFDDYIEKFISQKT
ncbi:glycosyltransferase [Candidatus Woesearchaeota archaeon]|nr:glycosyltransferase [Candidatus Woesearchaeota archaeon]